MSSVDRKHFEQWVDEDPRRRGELIMLRRLWDDAAAIPSPATVDGMWRALTRRLRPATAPATPGRLTRVADVPAAEPPQRRGTVVIPLASTTYGMMPKIAVLAAAVLCFVTGAVMARRNNGPASTVSSVREFRTRPGQRATVQLSDGSRVELGVASALRILAFTDSTRDVELVGEAVFDVVHDERRPFHVRSSDAVVEDLGTRFSVRNYADDQSVRVIMMSGLASVRGIRPGAAARVLRPGDLARVARNGTVTTESAIDTAGYLAWTNGRIVIRSQPLSEAVLELERWYDARIEIADERIARLRITVDMQPGSLEQSLTAVTVPLGLRFDLTHGGAIIGRPRGD